MEIQSRVERGPDLYSKERARHVAEGHRRRKGLAVIAVIQTVRIHSHLKDGLHKNHCLRRVCEEVHLRDALRESPRHRRISGQVHLPGGLREDHRYHRIRRDDHLS